jgi:DNA-binding Xre family transcriptional regulator
MNPPGVPIVVFRRIHAKLKNIDPESWREHMTMTVRIRLADILRQHQISQRRLAEKAGMHTSTLNNIYKGKIEGMDFRTLINLVRGFRLLGVEVNVGDLLEVVEDASDTHTEAAKQRALALIQGDPHRKPAGLTNPVPFRGPSSEDLLKADRGPAL